MATVDREQQRKHHQMFRILSIDGGGIRGAFAASCLAEMERRLECRVVDYFDLIAGTSTGGIIAVALALGISAQEIEDMYKDKGDAIFTRRKPHKTSIWKKPFIWAINRKLLRYGFDWDLLVQSKYTPDTLKSTLSAKLKDRRLGDAKCRLVIPSVDLTCGKTVVFKTAHLPEFHTDLNRRALDVILATSAAPTYFPHATSSPGSAYADGGLWANNPSMVAYVEALRISREATRPSIDLAFQSNQIQLLSIGAGTAKYSAQPPQHGAGLGWWASRLVDVLFISQSQGVDFQMRHVLADRYCRLNFDLPTSDWSLDATKYIPQLLHYGQEVVKTQFSHLEDTYFRRKAPKFEPFHLCIKNEHSGSKVENNEI